MPTMHQASNVHGAHLPGEGTSGVKPLGCMPDLMWFVRLVFARRRALELYSYCASLAQVYVVRYRTLSRFLLLRSIRERPGTPVDLIQHLHRCKKEDS